jgi:hypothetical protein
MSAPAALALQRAVGNQVASRILDDRQAHVAGDRGRDTASRSAQRAGARPVQRYFSQLIQQDNIRKRAETAEGEQDLTNDDSFFPMQVKRNGSFYSTEPDAKYPEANIEKKTDLPLRVSDDFNMAVPHGGPEKQAKTFYATAEIIDRSNAALKGKVELVKTSKYVVLSYKDHGGSDREKKLYMVEPRRKDRQTESGLKLTSPQRCSEMAEFVTGRRRIDGAGSDKYWEAIAGILDTLKPEGLDRIKSKSRRDGRFARYRKALDGGAISDYGRVREELSDEFQKLMQSDPQRMCREIEKRKINEYIDAPDPGDTVMAMAYGNRQQEAQRPAAGTGEAAAYHFAGIVARSGGDYIAMENLARSDSRGSQSLSSNDPLYFFMMYGIDRDKQQTWHQTREGSGSYTGALLSIKFAG